MKNTNHSLFDKYEMIKDLGTGSSGSVTLVRHISMDQERALKKVPKASAFAESALSEARLLKSLEHPSIPRIFDFEDDDAFYYIVEEYIDGETLDSFLLHQQLISLELINLVIVSSIYQLLLEWLHQTWGID